MEGTINIPDRKKAWIPILDNLVPLSVYLFTDSGYANDRLEN